MQRGRAVGGVEPEEDADGRGDAYGQQGNYDSEIADESKAIKLNPQYSTAYAYRGFAYGNQEHDRCVLRQNISQRPTPVISLKP